ncbi:MAG: hypothetical protein KIT43_08410 [Bauldia sp.]|nr:hypothetical protein [Bauldia sp.]MCW5716853.1 hypothetical protein [Bauldia sp.]
MTRKYLLGAAAVALFATAGAARAADVMPIVVAVTPTVAPVVVGPTVTVQIEAGTYLYFDPPSYWYLGTGFDGEVDVKSASGWGFHLYGGAGAYFPGFGFGYGGMAELYRIIGNAEVGFAVGTGGINFGPTFRYETDRFEFAHQTYISYLGGGAWDFELENLLEVQVNERLKIEAYSEFDFGFYGPDLDVGIYADFEPNDRLKIEGWAWADLIGSPSAGAGGQATLNLGALSPYVGGQVSYGMGLHLDFWAGVELERPIGTGPLTLIGDAGVGMYLGGTPNFYAEIGIRYNFGDRDNIRFLDDGS